MPSRRCSPSLRSFLTVPGGVAGHRRPPEFLPVQVCMSWIDVLTAVLFPFCFFDIGSLNAGPQPEVCNEQRELHVVHLRSDARCDDRFIVRAEVRVRDTRAYCVAGETRPGCINGTSWT